MSKSTENQNMLVIPADDETVKAVVNQIRADLRCEARYGAYVERFKVTRETVKDHALALARLVTTETAQTVKSEDGTKVRTKFGNAVQAAGNGLRRALGKDENAEQTETDWLRLFTQAAENAHNHEVPTQAMLDVLHRIVNADEQQVEEQQAA